ncbi:Fic family protein [Sphingomonas sp. NY01]|uniref:Fic family protein n=1 Tax=Sphingomonas sp. NY01 TaxID=2968057 RepID=UPI00315DFB34
MGADLPGRPLGAQLLGYSALIDAYQLECPPPRRLTAIAAVGQKTTIMREGVEWVLLPRSARLRVPDAPIEHLGVALKHEGVDLRVIDRLFRRDVRAELGAYIDANRAGLYTRRAWFLYEWMTGNRLPIEEPYGAQYVPLLDPNMYIGRRPTRSSRHKVDNNLTGERGFCPLIRRTERLAIGRVEQLVAEAKAIVAGADPAVLRRAVGFMLLNESKGSFGIEGETPPRNRLERWGRLIAEAGGIDLNLDKLNGLHRSLFDPKQRFVTYGLRTEHGFVGRHDDFTQPIPDHISARPDDVPSLLDGLFQAYALLKSRRYDPVLTAAIIGFGFVFIHPFTDGNGRLHRFLIQKALVDMKFNPDGVVLPVSAAILQDLLGYRAALEDYSVPTLQGIEWEPDQDGNVRVTNDTAYLYRYFDATRQAEYLLDRIEQTVRFSLPAELAYLHRFDEAKRLIAQVADMPDRLVSLFIQFCNQNEGRLLRQKRDIFFAELTDAEVSALEAAVEASGIGGLAH